MVNAPRRLGGCEGRSGTHARTAGDAAKTIPPTNPSVAVHMTAPAGHASAEKIATTPGIEAASLVSIDRRCP